MNKYSLNDVLNQAEKTSLFMTMRQLFPFLRDKKIYLAGALVAVLVSTGLNLATPLLIGYTIDTYIQSKNLQGVFLYSGILLGISLLALVVNYVQTMFMGTASQHMLFQLRRAIFAKLQSLPVAFFNQNKAGDLISRINSDTDKLNQFFSQSLIQFVSNSMIILGSGIFILLINWRLGLAALVPALGLFLFTQLISPWMKRTNALNLKSTGGMSAEISESLEQFKVIVAFNRRDYFRKKFEDVNNANYHYSVRAGVANNTLTPVYGFATNIAQLIVIGYGMHLILTGACTIGVLISFFTYLTRFYDPLRQMATVWSNFQIALAGSDRIHAILSLESDLPVLEAFEPVPLNAPLLEFKKVSFQYPDGKEVLSHIDFQLERGKTYALVGPTGGGKTTTASLMARLYDPTEGTIRFNGVDLRTLNKEERTQKIGFILQDPFLFVGTIRENILYGNSFFNHSSKEELETILNQNGLEALVSRFEFGLETPVAVNGGTFSLGQKQLIAFMRALLRNPELLILDEATANIDTVTEQLLEEILLKLPVTTTKVIIAHRLNTIENADVIFFVNGGEVTHAGSMEQAIDLLLHGRRSS